MSTLSIIWVIALVIMVSILLYARREVSDSANSPVNPLRLRDLARKEAHLLLRDTISAFQQMKPHGTRALNSGVVFVRRGQDFFIAQVYGKIKVHQGSASSFFLKQIREHQGRDVERSLGSREM